MRLLYVFPHPDDESFGPAQVMYQQKQDGHEVHLLTLTHGEATKQRVQLGYSKQQMGEQRAREMQCVKEVLGLDSMEIWHYPDNGLAEMDPRELENSIIKYIERLKPDILVSYPVYGISGFNDHLVMHAVAKRVFLDMRDKDSSYLKRLAFFTLHEEQAKQGFFSLKGSQRELIDCEVVVDSKCKEKMNEALDCYTTYQEVIKKTGVRENQWESVPFELFQEAFDPPLKALTEYLPY